MFAIGRRGLILGASALAFGGMSACNRGGGGALTADDMVLGNDSAPVTLVEYASTTCPHCAEFHETGGASPEQYFTRVGELFRQQQAIFATGSMEGVRAKLVEIGGAAGLSEQQVLECISDEAGAERVRRIVDGADNVTGTPTFVINGTKFEQAPTYENLSRALEAAGA
jgi:protein-disulfide isomerase